MAALTNRVPGRYLPSLALITIGAIFYYSYWQEGNEEPGARMAARYLIRLALLLFAFTCVGRGSRPYWTISFALALISYAVALIWVDVVSWEKPLTDARPIMLAGGIVVYGLLMVLCAAAIVKILRPWWMPPMGLRWTLYGMQTAVGVAVLAVVVRGVWL